jgi:hypothetical protein
VRGPSAARLADLRPNERSVGMMDGMAKASAWACHPQSRPKSPPHRPEKNAPARALTLQRVSVGGVSRVRAKASHRLDGAYCSK